MKKKQKKQNKKQLLFDNALKNVKNISDLITLIDNFYVQEKIKLIKSKWINVFLNLTFFVMNAIVVVLTLVIIGKASDQNNPQLKDTYENIKQIFVVISVISAIITFLNSLSTLLNLKNKKDTYIQRINALKRTKDKFIEETKNINDSSQNEFNELIINVFEDINNINDNEYNVK